jgi:N6-L-threonylcarbamoyladenine synthase
LIHEKYGGVVPELASRAHQENILPVVERAIEEAGITLKDIQAVAFTQGPGLLGSLVVGVSFAKAFALARNIPLLAVHHMKAHILAHFIDDEEKEKPTFPFLCLTVSGGHTQIVLVESHLKMSILGKTIDDAAGEAFDKAAKMLGFSYPGGPLIDKFAQLGNPDKFTFSKPRIQGLDFSFSGLKTSILYSIRDAQKENPNFIEENRNDLCASIQKSIVTILMQKLELAVQQTGIYKVALAGGVSANSELRKALNKKKMDNWKVYIPKFEYCTDNAAMIAITGKFLFDSGDFATQDVSAKARMDW